MENAQVYHRSKFESENHKFNVTWEMEESRAGNLFIASPDQLCLLLD